MTREYLLKLTADFAENSDELPEPLRRMRRRSKSCPAAFLQTILHATNYYGDNKDGTALNAGKEERCIGLRFYRAHHVRRFSLRRGVFPAQITGGRRSAPYAA
jgi:hypothetical protein